VQDDNVPGRPQLNLRLDRDALRKAGLNAAQLARQVRIAVDGEVVAFTRDQGDKIEVRVRSERTVRLEPATLLDEAIALPDGQITRLGALVEQEVSPDAASSAITTCAEPSPSKPISTRP
jgi:multidrug efflux pump subunit AcrB